MEFSVFLSIFAITMNTVVLNNLSIGYTQKGNEKVVAQGLNAAINSGELTCLLGCNGVGKLPLLARNCCEPEAFNVHFSFILFLIGLALSKLARRMCLFDTPSYLIHACAWKRLK